MGVHGTRPKKLGGNLEIILKRMALTKGVINNQNYRNNIRNICDRGDFKNPL